jgi:hypothetical protein
MKALVSDRTSRSRRLRSWPAIVLTAFSLGCASAHADEAKPNIVFVDGTAVTLSPNSSNEFNFDTPLKNTGSIPGEASVELLSGSDNGCGPGQVVKPKGKIKLSPNAVEITQFEISNVKLPTICHIQLKTDGTDGNTSLKQIKLTQQYSTLTVLLTLLGCFIISLVTAGAAWSKTRPSWDFKLGPPAWDFTKSWSSNTSLAGAIIVTALTLSALPELTQYASKSGYSILALLIAFAAIVAPFVFTAFRSGVIKKDPTTKLPFVEYHGFLCLFLISCAITMFAGLAQLVVAHWLLYEIFREYSLSWLLLVSMAALGGSMCVYACYSMRLTIQLQAGASTPTDNALAQKVPMLSWPIL